MKLNLLSFVVPALISKDGHVSLTHSGANVAQWALLPTDYGGEEPPPITSTLQISNLMYCFGDLRAIVKKHEKTFNEDLSNRRKKQVGLVEFDTPALVDTRNAAANPFPAAKMKNPVTAAAILRFLKLNQKHIRQDEGEDPQFVRSGEDNEGHIPHMIGVLEALGSEFDADILEFDDEHTDVGLRNTLVYSVVVNRKSKRITLVFRGSVKKVKDWVVNLRLFRTTIRTPPIIREFTGERNLKIAKGTADYLLSKPIMEDEPKMEQIINVLKEVYAFKDESNGRDYSDYKLYVTGHSLGGALAQLSAFVLAGSEKTAFIPKPINAITFASPIVGTSGFLKEYQKLERDGKLRHIRVSNQHDVVSSQPPGYTQTGVNFHVKAGEKMEVAYLNPKPVLSLLRRDSGAAHSLLSKVGYYPHIYAKDEHGNFLNQDDLDKSIEQLYDEYAELE